MKKKEKLFDGPALDPKLIISINKLQSEADEYREKLNALIKEKQEAKINFKEALRKMLPKDEGK